jgi:GNAT superfamily N-acetyltransferase
LAELILADDSQKRERDRLCHDSWGQRLTIDQFVAREERLRAHRWSQRGMTSWLWVEGRVLSSCETFEMTSFLDGKAGKTFGVASVYTEPSLRGRGHAARMMEAVAAQMPDHHAGILFSDIGDYYARFGWRAVPCFVRDFDAAPVESDAQLVSAGELDSLWNRLDVPRARFLVWPTADQLDWQRERERAYADLFGRSPLPFAGATTRHGVIAWAADFKNEKLLILHLQASRANELIDAARKIAFAANLKSVTAWDVLAPLPRGERPTDSLPMVLPIAPGSEHWSFVPRALWV